jgi:tetratricopeptide (TPR) repeat protein
MENRQTKYSATDWDAMFLNAIDLNNQGRFPEALALYEMLVNQFPEHNNLLIHYGGTLLCMGREEDSLRVYDKSLAFDNRQFNVFSNRAVALKKLKRFSEAVESCDQAIKLNPDYAIAYANRGDALQSLKRHTEALHSFEKALALSPGYALAYNYRGNALHDLKRLEEALDSYDRAIALNPEYAEAYSNRGNVLQDLKRLNEAVASYDNAIAINPDYAEAYYNRGVTLQYLNQFNDALTSYDRAIALNPDYAEAYSSRGVALQYFNRFHDALISYNLAITLNPEYVEAYICRGTAFQGLKQLDEAVADYDRAIVLNPNDTAAYWNKSLLKILNGEYEEGWRLYEWRWKKSPLIDTLRTYQQPLWLGEPSLSNKTLLIYPEQGLGDYIQFIRYATLVEQLGAKVILEVPAPLISIALTLTGQFTAVAQGEPLPDFDYHCPIMSLPLAFKTTAKTIPAQNPYLYADKDKQSIWRQRLGEKSRSRVGLVFSGSESNDNDHNRSIALKQFELLFSLPIEFHCLQRDIRPDDAVFMANNKQIKSHHDLLYDFSDTAALVEEMDLVVSVDTSVAHLAAALGKKVWILLPFVPDYRWMLDRTDSPWYPNVTLFRQTAMGDWDSVIEKLNGMLLAEFMA